jgi:hypothetical protein
MDVSLDVKIGQMIMVGFRGTDRCRRTHPFCARLAICTSVAVWLCDFCSPTGQPLGNIASPAQLAELVTTLHNGRRNPPARRDRRGRGAGRPPQARVRLSADAVRRTTGRDQRRLEATRQQADQLAATRCGSLGINFNLAPVVDLNLAPDNPALGRKGRCFSADPQVVTAHARAFIEQHHRAGIACAVEALPRPGQRARRHPHRLRRRQPYLVPRRAAPVRGAFQRKSRRRRPHRPPADRAPGPDVSGHAIARHRDRPAAQRTRLRRRADFRRSGHVRDSRPLFV